MIQTIRKWRITTRLAGKNPQVIYISDNYIQNVLRQLASITYDGQEVALEIQLVQWEDRNEQI